MAATSADKGGFLLRRDCGSRKCVGIFLPLGRQECGKSLRSPAQPVVFKCERVLLDKPVLRVIEPGVAFRRLDKNGIVSRVAVSGFPRETGIPVAECRDGATHCGIRGKQGGVRRGDAEYGGKIV